MKFADFASLTAEISTHGDPLSVLDQKIKYGEEMIASMRRYRKAVATLLGKSESPAGTVQSATPARSTPRISPTQARQEIVLMLKSQAQITPKQICKKLGANPFAVNAYLGHQWFKKISRGVYSLTKEGMDVANWGK